MTCNKIIVLLLVLASLIPASVAADPIRIDPAEVDVGFDRLRQGWTGSVVVSGLGIAEVRAAFVGQQYTFIPNTIGQHIGFIAAPLDAERGFSRLSILVKYVDGSEDYFPYNIQITDNAFPRIDLTLPPALTNLLDEIVIGDELALLDQAITIPTAGGREWLAEGILQPFDFGYNDGFGTFRLFNQSVFQRHTGVDYPATIGTPIFVSASGEVVMVADLPIRGRYVLVSHGGGLYTGYAHLSASYVAVGDTVVQGEIIGEVGNSGRSLGPHLHWELAIGGTWIDPLQFLTELGNAF